MARAKAAKVVPSRTATPKAPRPVSDTATGVDITKHYLDIARVASAYFRSPQTVEHFRQAARAGHAGRLMDREDFCQDVAFAIHRKNGTAGAYDPTRASLGKYIWQVCFSVASHATECLDKVSLFSDPEDMALVSEDTQTLGSAIRGILEDNGAILARLAKASKKDAKTGQLRLFATRDEHPVFAEIADILAA